MNAAKLSILVRIFTGLFTLIIPAVYYQLPEKRYSIATYRAVRIKLDYKGKADILQIYLRNFDARYSSNEDINSTLFAVVKIKAIHFQAPVEIAMNEFRVADWWLDSMDLTREMQKATFNNVFNIGIALQEEGDHHFTVQTIELVGDWIAAETLMLTLIPAWMFLILREGFSRLYLMSAKYRKYDKLITELVDKYSTLETKKNEYENLSKRDELTGLLNRFGLKESIISTYVRTEQYQRGGVIALLDIDHFKRVNDKFGHDAGDKVLVQFASLIQNNIRTNDLVGRWGGEEFILICPDATIESGIAIAEKIREIVQHTQFPTGAENLRITTSIGISQLKDKDDFERALKRADEALYSAKSSGRNRIISEFTPMNNDNKVILFSGQTRA